VNIRAMQKLLSSIAVCALVLSACASQRAAQNAEPETAAEATAAAPATAAEATAESCPMPEGAEASEATAATDSTGPIVAPGMAKVGDKTTCLVSKETFVVKEDSPKAEYNGKTYYFCCPHCTGKFQANPAQFVPAT
jgi:YHS domain-containing protein